MKKIFVLLLTLFIFTGCSNTTVEKEENKDLQIADAMASIGGVDETLDKQKLSYEMTISNEGKLPVVEESIEIVLTDWINERLMENEITEKKFNEDNIMVKGYVIFDTKDLSKKDILENEPFIDGIKISTEDDGEIFIKSNF
ncbi:membrane lipoprotein lipid attachment site-containing protein [Paenisporosarcina sp. HGH0030]|uniref:membrane lipoprotein lipid attachment site-containing protein n=1 Tax=Paenisporosarcina sp. HGH0030 TaxID=1078085 RepID=UPI0003A60452|nr:membrane lipoprotein lipid attachment site-containing protein [Paenisporosarcina sp. HGH0030]